LLDLGEVVRRHGPAYLDRYGAAMPASHRRALEDIARCRTAALGGHLYRCERCGREHWQYHSCRNRSCPQCHRRDRERWLAHRRAELLPVPYFHVVFTVPHEVGEIIRRHQKTLYGLLMRTAASSLIDLARDPKHLGATVGVLAVLHTWGRTLTWHPHVHCLVTGGGLSADGKHWRPARNGYLVPVRALSRLFRGRFLALAAKALPVVTWPRAAWRKDWVVYSKPAVQGSETVLQYLGRYVHRVALTRSRIVSAGDDHIAFRYRPVDGKAWRTMRLAHQEFLRRFLQHVPPPRTHKVRYYGLWAPGHRQGLQRAQSLLGERPMETVPVSEQENGEDAPDTKTQGESQVTGQCPHCGCRRLVHVRHMPPVPRAPP
jgi:DNA-directed RNA polymerase subunit RPC12/RpoP